MRKPSLFTGNWYAMNLHYGVKGIAVCLTAALLAGCHNNHIITAEGQHPGALWTPDAVQSVVTAYPNPPYEPVIAAPVLSEEDMLPPVPEKTAVHRVSHKKSHKSAVKKEAKTGKTKTQKTATKPQAKASSVRPQTSVTPAKNTVAPVRNTAAADTSAPAVPDSDVVKAGKALLAKVSADPAWQRMSNGIYVRVIHKGQGKIVKNQIVKSAIREALATGVVTVDMDKTGETYDRVIDDYSSLFRQVLEDYLGRGGEAELVVPSDLAYGHAGQGTQIPPDAVMAYRIRVVDVQ